MTAHSRGARTALVVLLHLGLGSLALPALAMPAADPTAGTSAVAGPVLGSVASETEPADVLPVVVDVTEITPAVLAPGRDLTLTVNLQNMGTLALTEPRVLVHLDRRPYISRSSLDRWRHADPLAAAGAVVLEVDLPAPLAPGDSTTVEAVVPAASIGLRSQVTTWGARGLAVEVVDRADPARARQGLARTFALWFPSQDVTATQVTVLVPVVGPAVDRGSDAWLGELETLTRPGGRLAALLNATHDHPEVSWVLDPLLVEATTAAATTATPAPTEPSGPAEPGPEPSSTPTATATTGTADPDEVGPDGAGTEEAGTAARAWSSSLLSAMTNREVRLLPYGDTDVAALAHAGAAHLLTAAVERARDVALGTDLPDTAGTNVMWPAAALPDLTTAAFVGGDQDRAVVVGPGELPAPDVLTYTPSGRTTISTASGEVTVLVPDERLSTGLTSGLVADVAQDEEDGSARWRVLAARQVTGATAGQDLLAELAVITRERPSDARHLLLTVPRDWEPDASVVAGQLDALALAPWVQAEPVSALVGAPDPEVDRGTLPSRAVAPTEISAGDIAALQSAVEDRAALAQMVEDPAALLDDLDAELLVPLSVAWRQDPVGRAEVVRQSSARTQALRDAVSVQPGSTLNLLSTTGGLRVRVTNTLDQAIHVSVSLRVDDRRLVADEAVDVTIPPDDEQVVQVPVHAIQSADLAVVVEVRTPDGVLVDADTTLEVRVRAEWEGIGTAVIGALLGLGVIIGLIRTIRRGRTSSRAEPVTAGPDALSPEEVAEEANAAAQGSRVTGAAGATSEGAHATGGDDGPPPVHGTAP